MPARVLSPLGKQLRSVLSNLGQPRCSRPPGTRACAYLLPRPRNGNAIPASSRYQSSAATPAAAAEEDETAVYSPAQRQIQEETASPRDAARRRRWAYLDRITETLRHDTDSVNASPLGRVWEAGDVGELQINDESQEDVTLERILAKSTNARSSGSGMAEDEFMEAEWMRAEDEMRAEEEACLQAQGYSVDDMRAWAKIISTPDPLHAANALHTRIAEHGRASVPPVVLVRLLSRAYFSARSLRIIYRQTTLVLEHHLSESAATHVPYDISYALFVRLVHHARQVWPMALEHVPDILLTHFSQSTDGDSPPTVDQIQTITFILNKAIKLLAMPSAVAPFKSNIHEESGIVTILRFMADHSIQIDREGYRGVVSLQLKQRKTPEDNRWADLKMLSWPPWKEDRTALDSELTPQEHGMSKASQTLRRMRAAGYAPRDWEKVASIYAGWDTDGTPTIQTLALIPPVVPPFKNPSAIWVARIITTRTVQEAWACYLAYEDEKLPPDQDVYLAIFKKLHKEESRRRMPDKLKAARNDKYRRPLFPGDTPDVESLPPSTHLHTYTRTPPPTVREFYSMLQERGVQFSGYCLAFLVENAASLTEGMAYIITAMAHHQPLRALLVAEKSSLPHIPMPIFAAVMKLLCRFSKASIVRALPADVNRERAFNATILMHNQRLNSNHALVYAMTLLSLRQPLFLPPWNSVLQALGRTSSLGNIRSVVRDVGHRSSFSASSDMKHNVEEVEWRGAITAYRLLRRALSLMREVHLDLDVVGYKALCETTMNAVWGAWNIVRQASEREGSISKGSGSGIADERVREALQFLRSSAYRKRVMGEWWILVGKVDGHQPPQSVPEENHTSNTFGNGHPLPLHNLEIPSTPVLHAHIRALGWLGDYDGLLATVRWMVANETVLAQRREQDRNGDIIMRRALVAMRVFLERSWLPPPEQVEEAGRERKGRVDVVLKRMEAPAGKDVIEEVRALVEGVESWGGWAEDEEVEVYCREDWRFRGFGGREGGMMGL